MNIGAFSLVALCIIGWGIGSFLGKIATTRIGERAVFWNILSYAAATIVYCLIVFKAKGILSGDRGGMLIGFLAGIVSSVGLISFYALLTKKDASLVVPLTALYPALTAILAIIFLKEPLTILKALGVVLSVVAIALLSF
jgi:transporter family protein